MSSSKRKKIVERINSMNLCVRRFKPLIDTIGIITGLFLLFFTYRSLQNSSDMLQLRVNQELNRQKPIWNVEIFDKHNFIKFSDNYDNMKIQFGNVYFPSNFSKKIELRIDPPDFKINLNKFKILMMNKVLSEDRYDNKNTVYKDRLIMPIGIEIKYILNGETKTTYGLYGIQYSTERSELRNAKVFLKGLLFDKYLESQKKMIEELNKNY